MKRFIRWVTWWPAPYWTVRFNELSSFENIELEVVYLSGQSNMHEWDTEIKRFNHRYRFLEAGSGFSNYYQYRDKLVPRNPLPLLKGRFDILVTQYADIRCLLAMLFCTIYRIPYYLFVANTEFEERANNIVIELLKKVIFNNASGILATGPLQYKYAAKYAKTKGRINIIGNPSLPLQCDFSYNDQKEVLRKKFGWEDEPVLLFVGRLSRDKGLFDLFEALKLMKAEGGLIPRVVLVGSGPDKKELLEFAEKEGLIVEFLGFLNSDKLVEVYSAADFFVLPSRSEAWGLVVNEAMECGLPIVLSDKVGCHPVLLQIGQNGFLFQAGNIRDLKSTIIRVSTDKSLRCRFSSHSLLLIKEHSVTNWVENVVKALGIKR